MGAWPLSAERKIEVSAEQRLQMYVVNGSDGRCLVAVRLIVGVRYLERPLREVLLYCKKITETRQKKHLKMNKEVRMLLPKKDLIQVE